MSVRELISRVFYLYIVNINDNHYYLFIQLICTLLPCDTLLMPEFRTGNPDYGYSMPTPAGSTFNGH